MRVLQLAPLHGNGPVGPEMTYGPIPRVAASSAMALQALGHEVTFCAEQGSELPGVALIDVPACPPQNYDGQARAVMPLIEQGQFDVVHTHCAGSLLALIGAGAPAKTTLVASLHSQAQGSGPRYAPYIDPLQGIHAIALSEFQAGSLKPYLEVSGVVPNGVDSDVYKPSSPEESGGYALVLGRMTDEKGVAEAILAARRANVRLLLAGPVLPWDVEFFEEVVRPEIVPGSVEYLGPLTDCQKIPVLQRADALIQLSKQDEVCSLSVLEGLACGTPAIASSRGSLPEMIVDGVSGFICDEVETCCAALRKVQSLDRGEVRKRTISRYSWERTGEQLVALYERIVR